MKPYAESCVQNQAEICAVLQSLLASTKHVLEIGSGTGQHAVFFAKRMPHLIWQTSDVSEYHQGINLWLDEAELDNTRPPLNLNVSRNPWPKPISNIGIDALFSANAVHIMSWSHVCDYFKYGAETLEKNGSFILYGPFNYNGDFTSESNANFDQWLKSRDLNSGVRDFEALDKLAKANGMLLHKDIEMAANNRILCWKKS